MEEQEEQEEKEEEEEDKDSAVLTQVILCCLQVCVGCVYLSCARQEDGQNIADDV